MKSLAVIPARYAATRFPGKLMQQFGNTTVIAYTYLATKNTGLFDDVIVVTDSEEIAKEIKRHGGAVKMSSQEHESGTDRIAEIMREIEADVIVNVQGDAPFVKKEPLQKLIQSFQNNDVHVSSLMEILNDTEQLSDPNIVKVCVDKKNYSLFFSRSVIPYPRNTEAEIKYYKHIGVYAFRKQALLQFSEWPVSMLEDAEKLEQLRYLENGVSIKMVLSEPMGIDINTPEDLRKALLLLS